MFHPHDHNPSRAGHSYHHDNPNQPRVPRGHPDGGQWTTGRYGRLSDLGGLRTLADLGHPTGRSTATEPEYPLWPLSILEKFGLPIDPDYSPDWHTNDPPHLVRLAAMPWTSKRDRVFGQLELPLEFSPGGMGGRGSLPLSLPIRRFLQRSPTAGVLRTSKGDFELVSGTGGPAASMPKGARGFDGRVRLHAEGQAVAIMIREGITEGTLYLNNQKICYNCEKSLRFKLPPGFSLKIVLPNGIRRIFGAKR